MGDAGRLWVKEDGPAMQGFVQHVCEQVEVEVEGGGEGMGLGGWRGGLLVLCDIESFFRHGNFFDR